MKIGLFILVGIGCAAAYLSLVAHSWAEKPAPRQPASVSQAADLPR